MRDRLDFIGTVTPQLLGPLTQMWSTHSSAAVAAATPTAMAGMTFVLSQFLDKCLFQLLRHGFRPGSLRKAPEALATLGPLVEKTEAMYAAVAAGSRAAAPSLHTLIKGLGRLLGSQPQVFGLPTPGRECTLLSTVLQLALQVLSHGRTPTDSEDAPPGRPPLKDATPAMALRLVHLPTTRLETLVATARRTHEPEHRLDLEAQHESNMASIRSVLTPENCTQLVWVLITQFLPLDEGYLEEWMDEPERAVAEESRDELLEQGHGHAGDNSDAEDMSSRTAAMALLLALTTAFPEVAVPIRANTPRSPPHFDAEAVPLTDCLCLQLEKGCRRS